MQRPQDAADFISAARVAINDGHSELVVKIDAERFFPNACVPIAAAVSLYRDLGIEIAFDNEPEFLVRAGFDDPPLAEAGRFQGGEYPLSRVWRFEDPESVAALVTSQRLAIMERVELATHVARSFEWGLNELMDNALRHAGSKSGFAMTVVHPVNKRLATCVSDTGIGVYESLRRSKYRPRSPLDALTLAIQPGVTRDAESGQGNGLFGLAELARAGDGVLAMTSGSVGFRLRRDGTRQFRRQPFVDDRHPGTAVDFQLNADAEVDIATLLGYEPVDVVAESLVNDPNDAVVIPLEESTQGTGTRLAAEALRNKVVNTRSDTGAKIVLDFTGIGVVSSSFADELLGKLVLRYGFFGFQRVVELRGMNETLQAIANRAIAQRMAQTLNEPAAPGGHSDSPEV